MYSKIQAVDLFCGAGGLTRGLLDAGIDVRAGVDSNGDCKYAYSHNNEGVTFINKSVTELAADEVSHLFEPRHTRLLCGCAPCQTFSSMNQRDEDGRRKDRRWTLLLEFGRLVREVRPELVTMENVPGIERTDVFKSFLGILRDEGYHVDYKVVDCSSYGMPQRRHRIVLLGSPLGEVRDPTRDEGGATPSTVGVAIGDLPPLSAGQTDQEDPLHSSSSLSELNLRRIRASVPGGTWRQWDDDLVLPCHGKKEGDGYGAVYGRMEWDKPAPTITTQFYNYGSGRFGHPEQDRAISLREGAILQGFPRSYQFEDPQRHLGRRALGMMIGNAVPVGLANLIGVTLERHVEETDHR